MNTATSGGGALSRRKEKVSHLTGLICVDRRYKLSVKCSKCTSDRTAYWHSITANVSVLVDTLLTEIMISQKFEETFLHTPCNFIVLLSRSTAGNDSL